MKVNLENAQTLQGEARFQAYACLDTTGTREIFDNLVKKLDADTARTYAWERMQQGPALTMTMRGVRVDEVELAKTRTAVARELSALIKQIQQTEAVQKWWDEKELNTGDCPEAPPRKGKNGETPGKHLWPRPGKGVKLDPSTLSCKRCGASRLIPKPFSPTSDDAVKKLLYEKIKAPRQTNRDGGLTANSDALESLIKKGRDKEKLSFLAEFCELMLKCRDLSKQKGFLNARIEKGRYFSSFNVGAAWTGRFSSSQDPFDNGGNLQNIAEKHRKIFVADPGCTMFYADLKTAESLLVAYMSGEEKYIEAHKGDVHTFVCREVWKDELPWTGDIKQDKIIATSHYPEWDKAPGHDYRFQSKRVQHGPLHPDMEVLTPHGWEKAGNLPECIAVWKDGRVWFERIAWNEGVSEQIVQISGENVRQIVSPDHRLPLWNNNKLTERLAKDLPLSYGMLPVTGTLESGDAAITPEEARLWAAAWADGRLEPEYPNSVRFDLTKRRKKERLAELVEPLRGLLQGLRLKQYDYQPNSVFRIYGFHRKALTWELLRAPLETRLAFLDELSHWDGSCHNGQLRVFNTDVEGLNIIQAVAHVSGKSFAIRMHGRARPNEKQCYFGTISNRQRTAYAGIQARTYPYGGRVICPVTTAGWVLCRKDGRVSVTGNSNYGLTPFGMAILAHIPVSAARDSQQRYFDAFPGIKAWQQWVIERVDRQLPLYNPLGRRIQLIGRPRDPSTHKQGLAFGPQSGIADVLNLALWKVWQKFDPELIQVLAQVHDAILGQFPTKWATEAIKALKETMEIPFPVTDIYGVTRICTIPVEIAVGKNWGKKSETNPEGLEEVKL